MASNMHKIHVCVVRWLINRDLLLNFDLMLASSLLILSLCLLEFTCIHKSHDCHVTVTWLSSTQICGGVFFKKAYDSVVNIHIVPALKQEIPAVHGSVIQGISLSLSLMHTHFYYNFSCVRSNGHFFFQTARVPCTSPLSRPAGARVLYRQ